MAREDRPTNTALFKLRPRLLTEVSQAIVCGLVLQEHILGLLTLLKSPGKASDI